MVNDQLKKPLPSESEQRDFYQKLRYRIQNWVESKTGKGSRLMKYVMFAPDFFHLLMKLMLDNRIDSKSKSMIGAGILYFFAPVDLLPEVILGPAGFADDVVVAVYIVNTLLNKYPKEIITSHWAGDEHLLDVISKLAGTGNKWASRLPAGKMVKRFLK
ncbi:YkvA family protein [Metaplanococcus flavidus]|uniref:YkvA family protein n=1 Tax=Metaplanococcus flavidus TaxID=569883 RepID=A0ABW3LG45_9BACL